MEDTNLGLERANKTVANLEEKISYLRDELKEARELIVNLQKRPDPLDDKSMGEKNVIIADLKLQLQNFEHHRNMMQKQVNAAVKQVAEFDELNAKYQSSATQLNELREQLRNSEAKRIIHARNEEQLRKDLEKLRDQSSRDQKMLSLRSDMINDLQDNERDCQLKIDKMYKEITSFEEVKKNLTLKEKEFSNLFGTLTFKQKELRRQDHAIKLMKEENSRIISRQTKQKERNTAMQAEIINLKKIIFKYAKLVIGTNGQKSFEVVPDLEDASINAPRLQPQPHPHPPQRRHRSMSLSHGRSFFDPLQRFHEQQQKLLQRQRRSTDSPRRMHQHNQEDRQQNPLNIPAPQQHSSQQNNQLNHHLHRRHRRHHRN
nr:synaptonemal complex protein 1-like [Drosophila bipectinata]